MPYFTQAEAGARYKHLPHGDSQVMMVCVTHWFSLVQRWSALCTGTWLSFPVLFKRIIFRGWKQWIWQAPHKLYRIRYLAQTPLTGTTVVAPIVIPRQYLWRAASTLLFILIDANKTTLTSKLVCGSQFPLMSTSGARNATIRYFPSRSCGRSNVTCPYGRTSKPNAAAHTRLLLEVSCG